MVYDKYALWLITQYLMSKWAHRANAKEMVFDYNQSVTFITEPIGNPK